MTSLLALVAAAAASAAFDPETPRGVCADEQAATHDGTIPLWSAIEHHRDPGTGLFTQEEFNAGLAWPENAPWAPWIGQCFGDTTPPSSDFLLHLGPREDVTFGTPILFVPGAGDNGSRGFIAMATRMDRVGRPVYAITFAHPHGDVFQQAETIANAIARIKARTGAAQVDVVAHSKGGIPAAIYASHHTTADWERADYVNFGTRYRGDIRRLVLIATPLGGVDTSYRWPSANFYSLEADDALAPVSWQTWYPSGSAVWWTSTDLGAQDYLPGNGDLFPGQRQLLARWDGVYELPGARTELGTFALQQDWYTTYEGGTGFFTFSEGIDAAIEAGDDVLGSLRSNGVDPAVELFLLAGTNPLLHNGAEYLADGGLAVAGPFGVSEAFAAAWAEVSDEALDTWSAFVSGLVGDGLIEQGISEDELRGMLQGKLVLGEVSGPSDGVVFVESATMGETLTARGAVVKDVEVVNLAHLDLLYASEITGQILQDAAAADPDENAWQGPLGERYAEASTLDWLQAVLEDAGGSDDGGDGGDGSDGGGDGGSGDGNADGGEPDTGSGDGGDDGPSVRDGSKSGWDPRGCAVSPAPAGWLALGLGLLGLARRRR